MARLDANQTFTGNNTFNGSNTVNGLAAFNNDLHLSSAASAFFGSGTRQMLNLYGTTYGIGVQPATLYFRCDASPAEPFAGFRWYRGGTHNDNNGNAGGGYTSKFYTVRTR